MVQLWKRRTSNHKHRLKPRSKKEFLSAALPNNWNPCPQRKQCTNDEQATHLETLWVLYHWNIHGLVLH